jgi:hypothetical protein
MQQCSVGYYINITSNASHSIDYQIYYFIQIQLSETTRDYGLGKTSLYKVKAPQASFMVRG